MTPVLRIAGAVLLAALMGLAAWSVQHQSSLPGRPGTQRDPDLAGLVERYDDGAVIASTVTDGMQRIAVTADTAVTVGGAPGTVADLRPGFLIATWRKPLPTGELVAAAIVALPMAR